jgi:hypothetical protein
MLFFGLLASFLIGALVVFVIALVAYVLFLLNLMRLLEAVQPQNRAMSPGLVWLSLIPVFNLGWMIYTVLKIKDSVRNENASRWGSSGNERNTHTIGLVYAILAAVAFVLSFGRYASSAFSALGGLVSLVVFILWIIYWVRTNRMGRDLQMTAGRGYGLAGPYGPGGQYGTGGSYSPSGPSYGPGGPGYGASYGPAPTAQADAPPPQWQPQTSPPPSGAGTFASANGPEGGRACSQCGKKLNPNDQFCVACGTAAPKE